MSILTQEQTIYNHLGVWAMPRDPDYLEPGDFPFNYELYGVGEKPHHWRSNAIFLFTIPVDVTIPSGLDLFHKCVETLDIQAKVARDKFAEEMAQIDQRRAQLLLLSAPTTTLIDGVELCDD